MTFTVSNKRDDCSIWIYASREDFKKFNGALKEYKTDQAAFGDLFLGGVSITLQRELDEEDKV